MKLNLIFFVCLLFCSLTTFLALRKYNDAAAVVIIAANPGGARKMSITHIEYSQDQPMVENIAQGTKISMENIDSINIVVKSENDRHNRTAATSSSNNKTSVPPTMTEAMDCLRQSKPDLHNVTYPDDALEHFLEIHKKLDKWIRTRTHKSSGYRGPWIGG